MIANHTAGLDCGNAKFPEPRAGETAGAPAHGVSLATRILIIEDEAMIAWTLESELEDMGFTNIGIAANGREAIAAAIACTPGLIVSDINLGGGVDGVSAVSTICASAWIPVLFVTGYAGEETRARIHRGVPGALILNKPIQTQDLHRAVIQVLEHGISQ